MFPKVSRSFDAKLASLPSKKHLWSAIWCQNRQPDQSYQPDQSACEHLRVFSCVGHVGPNDGVKITCHPDADPTSPTSYLMPSPTSYLMQLVPAVCAAALTVSCPPHGIRLGRRVGRIPIVAPVQLSETGDMLGAASLKRRSASAMSAACADCVIMLSRSSRVAASPS